MGAHEYNCWLLMGKLLISSLYRPEETESSLSLSLSGPSMLLYAEHTYNLTNEPLFLYLFNSSGHAP